MNRVVLFNADDSQLFGSGKFRIGYRQAINPFRVFATRG